MSRRRLNPQLGFCILAHNYRGAKESGPLNRHIFAPERRCQRRLVTRADKILTRIRRTPFGWGQDDLRRLYLAYGFEVREGARHLVVRHADHHDLVTTVARHDQLPPAYARTAVRLIEEVIRRRGMMSEGSDTP